MATDPIPAIDMWAPIVGTPEIIRQAMEHFPERMLGYLRVFFKHTPTREQIAQLRAFEQTEEQLLAARSTRPPSLALSSRDSTKRTQRRRHLHDQ